MVVRVCHELGWEWNPAIKEQKWRSVNDMVDYYNNEIDIYIDASSTAGRLFIGFTLLVFGMDLSENVL